MAFMFHIKIYVSKHNICDRSATEWFDTIVLLEYRLVGSIRNKWVLNSKILVLLLLPRNRTWHNQQSHFFINYIETKKMTKSGTNRSTESRGHIRRETNMYPETMARKLRQYTKRKYKMEITEVLQKAEITQNDWIHKETEKQEDFIRGVGKEALYQMTRAEHKPEPDNIAKKSYQNIWGLLLVKKRLITTVENSSGQDRLKPKEQGTSGGRDW